MRAFDIILTRGKIGEIYNIGCDSKGMEYSVLDIAKILIKKIKNIKKQNFDENDDVFVKWVEYVEDRPFNDVRYYISNSKLKKLGWDITKKFEESIDELL